MRLKPVLYILILLILLSACQKQIPPTARTPIVEPSILGLAAPDIDRSTASAPSDQSRQILRQGLAWGRAPSITGQEPAASNHKGERHAA